MIKHSKCCNAPLIGLHSSNTKICSKCMKEVPWPVEEGQEPTLRNIEPYDKQEITDEQNTNI